MREMIPLEEARALVCGAVEKLPVETVELLDAVGRVVAADQISDIDVSPFAHSAMDGFALRAAEIADAAEESPAMLRVIAEIGAGDVFEGTIGEGECVRIMTGACLPADADAVVKYEIVGVVKGDGKPGSVVSFSAPTKVGSNIRAAGEEAHAALRRQDEFFRVEKNVLSARRRKHRLEVSEGAHARHAYHYGS